VELAHIIPVVFICRLIVMSRVCQLTGKRANNGMAVSHSHVRTKKLQQVNLQERRLWWAEGNRWVRLRIATSALRTIQKKGLGPFAKELGLNLAKL
jgi:large subunit ribosomal protein L28